MNREKPKCYTSGPIENTKDAYTWRHKMVRELSNHYDIIVPDQMVCPYQKTDPEYGAWIKHWYVLPDMAAVATSKHVFVLIDHCYSSGTYSELSVAAWLGKDIVCCLDGVNLLDLPLWIRGCLDGATFVDSVDAGIRHYLELADAMSAEGIRISPNTGRPFTYEIPTPDIIPCNAILRDPSKSGLENI